MKEVFDYVLSIDNKAKYDHNMSHAKQITKFDDTYDLQYFNYKGTFLIENRDFYVATYHKFGEDFSEIFCTSFDDPKYPPIKKETPMQQQLMEILWQSPSHQLSKAEICDALWPKKPDASETLYTLIRRLKPIIEEHSDLKIESDRGKTYGLKIK